MTRLPSTLLTAVLGAIAAIAVILAAMLVVTSGWFIALKLYDDFGWAHTTLRTLEILIGIDSDADPNFESNV